jgi:acetyl-CoA synthetase
LFPARAQSTFTSSEQRDFSEYKQEYEFSLKHPAAYWKAIGEKYLSWEKPFSSSFAGSLAKGDLRYYVGGKLNASYNAVDRHVEKGLGDHRALIWEGDEASETREISYNQLAEGVNRFANLLKSLGIGPNDAVVIYMPPCPEAVYAMLGCARIGAVCFEVGRRKSVLTCFCKMHAVVFAGFSAEALRSRIQHVKAKLVVTVDTMMRSGRSVRGRAQCVDLSFLC